MLVIIACQDRYLRENVANLVAGAGLRSIRTNQLDRIIKELKQRDRCVIVDMTWEEIQMPGVLRQCVNIGRITSNKVVCICPNQDEELKMMAKEARPYEIFIRFDLHTRFKQFLKEL
jgi:FixJ family two-component response regulator